MGLRLHGLWIERQRVLEQADRLCVDIPRIRLESCGAPPENIVLRGGVLGRPGGLRSDQLDAESARDPAGDLILQSEQIVGVAVELLSP